jgi:hypothetical protein
MSFGSAVGSWWVAGVIGSVVVALAVGILWWLLADFVLATGGMPFGGWLERWRRARRPSSDARDEGTPRRAGA